MLAIYKKDVKSAFHGMTGWVMCAFVTFVSALYFTALCLNGGYAEYSYVLSNVTFIFIAIVPLLTMRSVVEERRQKTDQLLLTSPASIGSIVWGKYLALLTIFAVPFAVMAVCPLIMTAFGTVSLARCYAALLAFFLMGAAAIAVGLFMSSLTENQIIAAVCSFGALLLLYLMPSIASLMPASAGINAMALGLLCALIALALFGMLKSLLIPCILFLLSCGGLAAITFLQPAWLEGSVARLLNAMGLFARFDNFVNGIFDVTGLVYFISVALLFVFLTCQSFEKRRWN